MAAREVHFEQDVPGGKAWFKRADIDAWRRGERPASRLRRRHERAEAAAAVAARHERASQSGASRCPATAASTGGRTACSRSATATRTGGSAGAGRSRRSRRRAPPAATRGRRARGGERESANPRLKFGEAADRWLAEQVVELRPATRASYSNAVRNHLRAALGRPADGRDRRHRRGAPGARAARGRAWASGRSSGVLHGREPGVQVRAAPLPRGAGRTRSLCWRAGSGRRPSATPERRIYVGDELAQVLAASTEPWTTLFRLAERRRPAARASCSGCGGRTSTLRDLGRGDDPLHASGGPRAASGSS